MRWRRKKQKQSGNSTLNSTGETEASNKILVVPRGTLHATHQFFTPYWAAGVETACYWFGVSAGAFHIVTTLVLPKLYQSPGGFRVDSRSMRRLAKAMSQQRLENLAQLHTHPSNWVGHSAFDDDHAYSTRPGSLSLVWPNYGLSLNHDLTGIGIHEYRTGVWNELSPDEVRERIRVIDSVADGRWQIEGGFTTHVERDF